MDKLLLTKCLRCRDAAIYDKFTVPMDSFGMKMLISGKIVDPVILKNRQLIRSGQGINLLIEKMRVSKMHP